MSDVEHWVDLHRAAREIPLEIGAADDTDVVIGLGDDVCCLLDVGASPDSPRFGSSKVDRRAVWPYTTGRADAMLDP